MAETWKALSKIEGVDEFIDAVDKYLEESSDVNKSDDLTALAKKCKVNLRGDTEVDAVGYLISHYFKVSKAEQRAMTKFGLAWNVKPPKGQRRKINPAIEPIGSIYKYLFARWISYWQEKLQENGTPRNWADWLQENAGQFFGTFSQTPDLSYRRKQANPHDAASFTASPDNAAADHTGSERSIDHTSGERSVVTIADDFDASSNHTGGELPSFTNLTATDTTKRYGSPDTAPNAPKRSKLDNA
jgi:hypothetical protein